MNAMGLLKKGNKKLYFYTTQRIVTLSVVYFVYITKIITTQIIDVIGC